MAPKLPVPVRGRFAPARAFLASEDGAITIDWVVITSFLAGLGVAVIVTIANYLAPGTENLDTFLTDYTISETFD